MDAEHRSSGWGFYGRPNEQAMESMRRAAEHAGGCRSSSNPEFVGGFLRLQPA